MSGDVFAYKALRCDCGYEVRGDDEAACVEEVRRHASETHGIDLSDELALHLVQRAGLVSSGERNSNPALGEEQK